MCERDIRVYAEARYQLCNRISGSYVFISFQSWNAFRCRPLIATGRSSELELAEAFPPPKRLTNEAAGRLSSRLFEYEPQRKNIPMSPPNRPRHLGNGSTSSRVPKSSTQPMRSNVAAIEARQLCVTSGDFMLLSPTDIDLPLGRCLVINGDNGSGKTTLLSVLTGLQPPTRGTVTLCGIRPDDRHSDFRAAVTGLIGRAPISRELTVAEHLEAIAMSWSLPDPKTAALRQLNELEIGFLAQRFAHELSSGQTQLMQLAMVLIRPARILVLDEPEQRLDSSRLDLLLSVLEARAKNGTTLVLASHSPRIIDRLGEDHLHLMHHDRAPECPPAST